MLAQFEGIPTRAGVELSLMSRFYLFQVIVRTPPCATGSPQGDLHIHVFIMVVALVPDRVALRRHHQFARIHFE